MDFDAREYWRTIILYGGNVATYKIALGKSIIDFAKAKKSTVNMTELSIKFFEEYKERLNKNMPQLSIPNRKTVMETVVDLYKIGSISYDKAIDMVKQNAFNDVIPRFHNLNGQPIDMKFYDINKSGLVLTDNIFRLCEEKDLDILVDELLSRWSLLEASFEMSKEQAYISNDADQIRLEYLKKGYPRTNITHLVPVLNGYQKGICFYCGESIINQTIHVDHVIPRRFLNHDEIWNLVLAHDFCNEQKTDLIPPKEYIEKLIQRNEYFIISNHPIKNKLIVSLGLTSKQRRNYIYKVYEDCKSVLGYRYTWDGIKGYNPSTDEFYKTIVRELIK
jgi:hypothetical protein